MLHREDKTGPVQCFFNKWSSMVIFSRKKHFFHREFTWLVNRTFLSWANCSHFYFISWSVCLSWWRREHCYGPGMSQEGKNSPQWEMTPAGFWSLQLSGILRLRSKQLGAVSTQQQKNWPLAPGLFPFISPALPFKSFVAKIYLFLQRFSTSLEITSFRGVQQPWVCNILAAWTVGTYWGSSLSH